MITSGALVLALGGAACKGGEGADGASVVMVPTAFGPDERCPNGGQLVQ